jgi:two-component system response regulator ChvI
MDELRPRRLVLVDDDAVFLRAFALNLETAGYQVGCFTDSRRALDALKREALPDACIFDWNMPGLDGLALLRAIREASVEAPVMFLTSHGDPMYEELALDQGAVDFVDKTRSPAIILRRLALILDGQKQLGGASDANASGSRAIGPLELNPESKRAFWRGREVSLSLGEYEVVALLASKADSDVAYREIYDAIRGDGFFAGQGEEGYRANVRAMIKRIRRKFTDLDIDFAALDNYPGFGYRWRKDA